MPARIWLWTGLLIVALAAAFVALTIAVPEPERLLTRQAAEPLVPDASPPAPDAEALAQQLLADLRAVAAARSSPAPAAPGYAPWTSVIPSRSAIAFFYRLPVLPGYQAPADPTELFPGFEAYRCSTGNGTCFRATPALIASTCADPELRPLMDRGAFVFFTFRNDNVVPIGSQTVRADMCTDG